MSDPVRSQPGRPAPLGAHWDGSGVNFAVHAPDATAVTVCLFVDRHDAHPAHELQLLERSASIWHGYLPGFGPGLAYGLRVDGPWDPARGLRFNRHKLLVDPHALALSGSVRWADALFGHVPGQLSIRNDVDSAPFVPRSLVVEPRFDWQGDTAPRTPWHQSVIYECHVQHLTAAHPDVPPELRGTYLGLCSAPILEHLHSLGVTAVELLPVHARVSEHALVQRGLENSWGYNTLGFFAADARFASADDGRQVAEFQQMVKTLHSAGIEVILDMVYNHTCEADLQGPTVSWRGLDNGGYYHHEADNPAQMIDVTGCGNSVDASGSPGLRMIMDSLRHWVEVMHVDGFRFDLAGTLGRPRGAGPPDGRFFDIVSQDPLLARTKLIAEPWDCRADGHIQGGLPSKWSEWNGRYRDRVRQFWRGDHGQRAALASRISGSADLVAGATRRSINFITCHDGFTLADLVSYESKHNEANGEENRDGSNDNNSCHWGVEGPTDELSITALRERARRNMVATLLLSCGVPMLLSGDELSHSQQGNNNSYCQSGEDAHLSWNLNQSQSDFLAFVRHVSAVARQHPILRRKQHFTGEHNPALRGKDLSWIRAAGSELHNSDWDDESDLVLGALLVGSAVDSEGNTTIHDPAGAPLPSLDHRAQPHAEADLMLLLNGSVDAQQFELPERGRAHGWTRLVDTDNPARHGTKQPTNPSTVELPAHSLILLRLDEPAS
ncbi:MAG: isoamylase [Pseudohongiellaceae bacterium]|jgi:isoamylase